MSKKYIIEIEEAPYMNVRTTADKLYKAVGFNSLVFDQNGLDKLEPLDDACKNCLDKGDADASYQQGLKDAWDAAKKLFLYPSDDGYSVGELDACFGTERKTAYELFRDYTAAEAVEKIREYEERKTQKDAEIHVGDVVEDEDGVVAIVVRITTYLASLIVANGDEYGYIHYARNKTRLTKTGRHVDLSELFGGEEG